MKKIVLILIVTFSFSVVAAAQNISASTGKTADGEINFKSDGCSLFFDCDFRDCCEAHDKAYFFGGNWKERWRADKLLYQCVSRKKGWHHRIVAPIMWLGVRFGGVSWLPTSFRWGFGQEKSERNNKLKKSKINKPKRLKLIPEKQKTAAIN